jgi:hypothetical protein
MGAGTSSIHVQSIRTAHGCLSKTICMAIVTLLQYAMIATVVGILFGRQAVRIPIRGGDRSWAIRKKSKEGQASTR